MSFVRLKLKAVGILLLIIFGMLNVLSFNVGNYGGTAFSATSESGDYEVVTLASGLSEPSFVAVDSKFVYFTEKGSLAIKKVPLYGGDVQTLATGGSFTTTGPTPILVGDNTSGQERITVEPVGGNGGNQTMILNIDGQQFMGWMQNQLDNGRLRVPRRILA